MAALEEGKTRRTRKSKEDRLQELEQKRRQLELRAKQQMEAMEAKIKRLQQNGKDNRILEKERAALMKNLFKLVPEWNAARILGAIAHTKQQTENNPALTDELDHLGQQQQEALQGRRGRRKQQ